MHFTLVVVIILINLCGHGVLSDRRPSIIHPKISARPTHNARQESNSLGPYVRPNHQLIPANNTNGRTFDRFVQIWLWNQDYGTAAKDRKLKPVYAPASMIRLLIFSSITPVVGKTRNHSDQLPFPLAHTPSELHRISRRSTLQESTWG
jgi:hypothetical protein